MFEKLLATLDGSSASEAALTYLTELVRVLGPKEVLLLRVVETGGEEESHLTETYLQEVTARLKQSWEPLLPAMPELSWSTIKGVQTDTPIRGRGGEVSGGILKFARAHQPDLIVMCTHGRTGFNRWLLGSVAEQVLRSAEAPIFLVRTPGEDTDLAFELKRVLTPLDGSSVGEQCLPFVEELARKASPEIVLLHVETPSSAEPSGYSREDTLTYLDHIAAGLRAAGSPVETRVRRGRPGEEILNESRESGADLLVMSSHGRAGLGRLALGSVAYNVVSNCDAPVFLVRANRDAAIVEYLQSPRVYRCYHCGNRTYLDAFSSADRCGRCHYHLKACGNCVHFNGVACVLQLPDAAETYPGNRCQSFEFRKTRLVT